MFSSGMIATVPEQVKEHRKVPHSVCIAFQKPPSVIHATGGGSAGCFSTNATGGKEEKLIADVSNHSPNTLISLETIIF